jgi:tyrosinase
MKIKKSLNRRDFIELTHAGSLALLIQSCRNSEIKQMTPDSKINIRQTPRIRYDIASSAEAAKRNVENLKKVVGIMKNLSESNYCSWIAQAKIHKENCPHDNGKTTFLPWHRAYLFYFEEICRKLLKDSGASGHDDFALPYWDWSKSPEMPEIFRKNSLQNDIPPPPGWINGSFQHERQNKPGDLPDIKKVGTDRINSILKKSFYGVVFGSAQLESGPHAHIHTGFIKGNMSDFATAALDPIFWVHHANIDRLWSKWMKLHKDETPSPNCQIECIGKNPLPIRKWLLSPVGRFYDAGGNLTNPQVCSLLNTFDSNVFNGGYHYEDDSVPIAFGECIVMPQTNRTGYWIRGEVGNDKIAGINGSVTVKVSDFTTIPQTLSDSLKALLTKIKLTSADTSAALLLTIEVEKPANSQISVGVFINAPKNLPELPVNSPSYVATFSFFESIGGSHQHGNEDTNAESRKFTFDVTDTILELSESEPFTLEEATVSISPKLSSGEEHNKESIRLISFEFDLVQ